MTVDLERSDLLRKVEGYYGGHSMYRRNVEDKKCHLIGDFSKEIIPFFAIDREVPTYRYKYGHYTKLGYPHGKVEMSEIFDMSKLESNGVPCDFLKQRLICDVHTKLGSRNSPLWDVFSFTGGMGYRHLYNKTKEDTFAELKDHKKALFQAIEDVKVEISSRVNRVTEVDTEYGVPLDTTHYQSWGNYWKYKETLGHFLMGNGFSKQRTRTMIQNENLKYFVGSYFLADGSGENHMIPLLCLVTKPKYVEYIRYSLILSKKIDPRVFQVWVHPEFDVPRSRWRGIRPYMRKEFLIPMYDAGVPIIEKKNVRELFKEFFPPKFSAIPEYKKWLNDCAKESIINIQQTISN